jgi:hypothetical protein
LQTPNKKEQEKQGSNPKLSKSLVNYLRYKQDPYMRNHQYLQESNSKLSFQSSTNRNISQDRIISETRLQTEDSGLFINEAPIQKTSLRHLKTYPEIIRSPKSPNSLTVSLIKLKDHLNYDSLTHTSNYKSKQAKYSLKKEMLNGTKSKNNYLMENLLNNTPKTPRKRIVLPMQAIIKEHPQKSNRLEYNRKINKSQSLDKNIINKIQSPVKISRTNSKISSFEYSYGKKNSNQKSMRHKVRIVKRSVSKGGTNMISRAKVKRSQSRPIQNSYNNKPSPKNNPLHSNIKSIQNLSSQVKEKRSRKQVHLINLNPYDYYNLPRTNQTVSKKIHYKSNSKSVPKTGLNQSSSMIRNKLQKIKHILKDDYLKKKSFFPKETKESEYYS